MLLSQSLSKSGVSSPTSFSTHTIVIIPKKVTEHKHTETTKRTLENLVSRGYHSTTHKILNHSQQQKIKHSTVVVFAQVRKSRLGERVFSPKHISLA
ncbi:hypothetical protein DEO72_LG5g878 [Vigna unguiculata]|uniref:Uncharacterized protein n=1 Tax=Vigna unguiculata TaxID=3917 RepID=A0A4D6LUS4_VIGUN|nr:hypothetical protein DEO72_LG5g878 [Vigna unguiculata]